MCGIVGFLSKENSLKSIDQVIEGLSRLEYRGYDSAGISFLDGAGEVALVKKEGKLQNLVDELSKTNPKSWISIGHTRWATHGAVNDKNAHPHVTEDIALVHNGIIENASELREKLQDHFTFKSETDSEVFLALLDILYRSGLSLKESICEGFKKLRGNSAFVIIDRKKQTIYSIRKAAPLVCGSNGVDTMVSSDPYALVGMASKIYFPEDEVLCELNSSLNGDILFYELDGAPSSRVQVKEQSLNLSPTDKGEFEHFMLKEIHEQPTLIKNLTTSHLGTSGLESLSKLEKFAGKSIQATACGTAFYAGMCMKPFFEGFNKTSFQTDLASEFRYRNPLIQSNDIGLFISQSGETADTLAAMQLCKEAGIPVVSIVNVEGSTLFRECDENLLINAGVEIGVASTKAFTQQVLTGRIMSFAMQGLHKNKEQVNKLKEKMCLLSERVEELISRSGDIQSIAREIYDCEGFFFTGRGLYYPVALEGALKLKEIAYVHAEGYAAGELKHGPIALIDQKKVNVALVGPELYEKTISNIEEIKARRGIIVSFAPAGDKRVQEISDYYLPLNFEGLEELSSVYINVANQLLSYYIAKEKGTDIDKPRNLAKSVTVE